MVRNAYRPDQQVTIYRLDELLELQFDMLTTIVIGNRFTQRKRDRIFTPRGYNDWATFAEKSLEQSLPAQAVWVFAGTSDGNALAKQLTDADYPVIVSAATAYGAELAAKDCPGAEVWMGQSGIEARRQALINSHAQVIVDATHPYANLISEQLMGLSQSLNIPYLRFERPSELDTDSNTICRSVSEAAQSAINMGQRIFLSTGSKDLASFLQTEGAANKQWFVRMTAEPDFIQRALELGISQSNICAMQGPFSKELNIALWRNWKIDCVVSKDSGEVGGYRAKADAAKELAIPLLVIQRPQLDYPLVYNDFESIQLQIAEWFIQQ